MRTDYDPRARARWPTREDNRHRGRDGSPQPSARRISVCGLLILNHGRLAAKRRRRRKELNFGSAPFEPFAANLGLII